MSDLSQDWCSICGQLVTGVLGGRQGCQIVYIWIEEDDTRREVAVCKNCIDLLNQARSKLENG